MDRWWRDPTNPNIRGFNHYYIQKPVMQQMPMNIQPIQNPVQMQVQNPVQMQQQVQKIFEQMPLEELYKIEKDIKKNIIKAVKIKHENIKKNKPLEPERPGDIIQEMYLFDPKDKKIADKMFYFLYELPKGMIPAEVYKKQALGKIKEKEIWKIKDELVIFNFIKNPKIYNEFIKLEIELLKSPTHTGSFTDRMKDIIKDIQQMISGDILLEKHNVIPFKIPKVALENFYKRVMKDYESLKLIYEQKIYRDERGFLPGDVKMFGSRKIKKI